MKPRARGGNNQPVTRNYVAIAAWRRNGGPMASTPDEGLDAGELAEDLAELLQEHPGMRLYGVKLPGSGPIAPR